MGEGMWMISPCPIFSLSAKGTRFESIVFDVWVTPFGSPVVPDVYRSWITASGERRKAFTRASSSALASRAISVSKSSSPVPPTTKTWVRSGNSPFTFMAMAR